MKVYGITGGAGTGKSEVIKMLQQNFGGCVGSSGSQPHLSHRYIGTPAGFFAPQF